MASVFLLQFIKLRAIYWCVLIVSMLSEISVRSQFIAGMRTATDSTSIVQIKRGPGSCKGVVEYSLNKNGWPERGILALISSKTEEKRENVEEIRLCRARCNNNSICTIYPNSIVTRNVKSDKEFTKAVIKNANRLSVLQTFHILTAPPDKVF